MDIREVIGQVLLLIVGVFAIASGVGGGSLFVPILVSFYGFSTRQAIGLSNSLIVFNSFTRYVLTIFDKNPMHKTRPIIDYNTAMMFMPMVLFGSSLGAV
jgi:hypothetical protein